MTNSFSTSNELLTTAQAAELLGIKKNTLEYWRLQGKSPVFLKIGKNVRYEKSEIVTFLESSRRTSTSDTGKR